MKRSKDYDVLVEGYLELFNMAHAILHDTSDAQDVVQEAIARTLVRWRTGNAMQYCKTVLFHECINVLRYRKKTSIIDDINLLHTTEPSELEQKVRQATNELDPVVRSLVELHDIDGYTISQLSTLTGSSTSTIHRLIQEAHKIIRKKINHPDI